jgi:excinuclease ABC subunit A
MVDRLMTPPAGSRIVVLAPVIRGRRGEYRTLFVDLRRCLRLQRPIMPD